MSKQNRGKSYSQAMNEWSMQRTFVKRLRSRVLFPAYDASWYGKLWGYLWRLGAVAFVFLSGAYVFLKLHHKNPAFRAHLAEEAAKLLKGTDATCGAFKWPVFTGEMGVTSLGMNGTTDSFFTRIDAHEISADVGLQAASSDWHLGRIKVNEAVVQLKSGSTGSGPAQQQTEKQIDRVAPPDGKTGGFRPEPRMLTAGFALRPDFANLTFEGIDFNNLTLTWGYSATTAGILSKATTFIDRTGNGFDLNCTNGVFSQNWLKGMKVAGIDAHIGEGKVEVRRATFAPPGGGQIVLTGNVTLGEMPEADLRLTLTDVALRKLTPEPFDKYFDVLVTGEGTVTGTINKQSGIRTKYHGIMSGTGLKAVSGSAGGAATEAKGLLTNIPLLRALSVAAVEDTLVQVPLTEGSFDAETGGGEMVLNNIEMRSGDRVRIRGAMAFQQEIEQLPPGKPGEEPPPPRIVGKAKGDLLIGIAPDTVAGMAPEIQKTYFNLEAEGFRWMRVTFHDEDGVAITSGVAEEVLRLHRESLGRKAP